ncbi:MAG TPA: GGDEF domain-containing protein [Mesorhizobium sp.]|jgi:diguanylate cyclase|nr:GGDEF domain-containing protein [Mesorhizobium sp.]
MQPASSAQQPERVSDLAATVVATMRQFGVAGLPRNYEIFYEALAGTNHELSLAVVSLPHHPTQEQLDEIGQRFFAHHHGLSIVDSARSIVACELEEVASLLRAERSHLERFGEILHRSSDGLAARNNVSRELFQKVLNVITVATSSTIERGRETAQALGDKSAELESVKSKLEEYKKLADTDPLTQIANRRAFDKELTRIYDTASGVMFKSLIIADIDRFKDVNDRFGHPAGDKVIQIIAGVFRASTDGEMFLARTGGEEFAIIVEGRSEDAAEEIAERVRAAVEQTALGHYVGAVCNPVTVSVGLCMASEAEGPDDLYAKADRALYRSKVNGRNRVTRHSALSEQQRASKNWMLYRKD